MKNKINKFFDPYFLRMRKQFSLVLMSLITLFFYNNCGQSGTIELNSTLAPLSKNDTNNYNPPINLDGDDQNENTTDITDNAGSETGSSSGTLPTIPSVPPAGSATTGGTTTSPTNTPPPPTVTTPSYSPQVSQIEISPITAKKVDVLIVIDNSGSMQFEQSSMARRFSTFIDKIKNLDWQLGITTTDVEYSSRYSVPELKDGRLIPLKNNPANGFLLNSSMNPIFTKEAFAATVYRPEVGDSREQGIKATYRVLERALDDRNLPADGPNRSLIRPDALLSVVVVTDADETPSSRSPEIRNTPNGLFNFVKNNWDSKKNLVFHSIIVKPGDRNCLKFPNSQNENYGSSYNQLSELTGGIVGSVCENDYGAQLARMGEVTTNSVSALQLNCYPVDRDNNGKPDIAIKYTEYGAAGSGRLLDPSSYSIAPNATWVQFNQVLNPGVYKAEYYCVN